jgi:molecular chaperone DnaK (HSP70)
MLRRVCRSSVAPAAFSRLASEKVQGEVIAIDLGTTYSCVAVMEGDKPRKPGIDLGKDKVALHRVREAADKAKCELSSAMQAEVNLPFISANSEGPQHIQMTLTRSKVEDPVRLTHPAPRRASSA